MVKNEAIFSSLTNKKSFHPKVKSIIIILVQGGPWELSKRCYLWKAASAVSAYTGLVNGIAGICKGKFQIDF